jgi:hypothetical protein
MNNHVFLVIVYLASIVLANLSIAYFGPAAAIVNAFLLVGPVFAIRDRLHEIWNGDHLTFRMSLLIAIGSLLSYILNRAAGPFALASFVSFVASESSDWIVFRSLSNHPWMIRSNLSNLIGSLVDSLIFPILAFGGFPIDIIAGQFFAKTLGGLVWSWILLRVRNPQILIVASPKGES